tara:strand:+ start:99 stop:296 length:198 start_codon:yes stop_codon:yes gene_type:complete
MHEANSIKLLYGGVSKDDSEPVVVIHHAEKGIAKTFFERSREVVEAPGRYLIQRFITRNLKSFSS